MDGEDFVAREGDVIVVSYPEVKIPLATKFGNIVVGGLIYTRHLVAGDSVETEHKRIYAFLKRMAERDAREKVQTWTEELAGKRPPPLPTPPKPAGADARPAAGKPTVYR